MVLSEKEKFPRLRFSKFSSSSLNSFNYRIFDFLELKTKTKQFPVLLFTKIGQFWFSLIRFVLLLIAVISITVCFLKSCLRQSLQRKRYRYH